MYADYCTCGYTKIWLNLCIPCCWFAINIKLISTFTFFISKKLNHFSLSSESIVDQACLFSLCCNLVLKRQNSVSNDIRNVYLFVPNNKSLNILVFKLNNVKDN